MLENFKEALMLAKYLWEQALTEAEKRYELSHTKIYIYGDGASWIQTGFEWFKNSIFVLDKYHKSKKILEMTTGLEKREKNQYFARPSFLLCLL